MDNDKLYMVTVYNASTGKRATLEVSGDLEALQERYPPDKNAKNDVTAKFWECVELKVRIAKEHD